MHPVLVLSVPHVRVSFLAKDVELEPFDVPASVLSLKSADQIRIDRPSIATCDQLDAQMGEAERRRAVSREARSAEMVLESVEGVEMGFPLSADLRRRARCRGAGSGVPRAQVDDRRVGERRRRCLSVGCIESEEGALEKVPQLPLLFVLLLSDVAHGGDLATERST